MLVALHTTITKYLQCLFHSLHLKCLSHWPSLILPACTVERWETDKTLFLTASKAFCHLEMQYYAGLCFQITFFLGFVQLLFHHKGLAPAIAAAAAVVPLCRNTNCTFATFAFLSHLWEKNLFSEEHSVQPALEDSILHEACRLHRLGSTLDSCDTQLQAVSPFLLPNDGHLSQLFLFRSGTSFSRVTNNIAGAGTSVTINCLHSESFFSAEIVPIQSEMFKA